ncbi:MAG TPA: helix-turn-helix domain-containing protein [Candidatus Saccharimonadales bacterium]|nr:helix-turn-helix domain-containing protein [Candidatus Saccharimonadales bacterium]
MERLTVPEVARRLGMPGPEVYQLIFSGELDGAPQPDGAVYVTAEALAAYQRKNGLPVS